MNWLFDILNLLFLKDHSGIFTLLLWGEKKFLTAIYLSSENNRDESYCFWKRLLMFLKEKMAAPIETDHINSNHLMVNYRQPQLTGLYGNRVGTLRCWKQCATCMVWWLWMCRCLLCSQSVNYTYTRLMGDNVWYTIGEHYLLQTGEQFALIF